MKQLHQDSFGRRIATDVIRHHRDEPLARINTDPLLPERRAQRYYFHTE